MNTIVNISNIIKGLFLVMILFSVFACSKGGEPSPMASSSSSSISVNNHDDAVMRVVGGDDKEDDDDNRGPKFPKRR
ncbi:MAG: hypothetical protein H6589_01875 [Flavobacteriales bacterium]|nr:hypothetical protein [Flavobacteriales bacterium]